LNRAALASTARRLGWKLLAKKKPKYQTLGDRVTKKAVGLK